MSKLGQRTGGKDAPILLCLDAREAAAAFLALDLTLKLSEEGVPEAEFPRPAIRCMQEIADAIVNDYPEASTIDFEDEELEEEEQAAERRAFEAEQEFGKTWEDLTDEDLERLERQNADAMDGEVVEELLDDEDEDEDEDEEDGEIRYPAMKLPKVAVK